jgi:hypothetical protein
MALLPVRKSFNRLTKVELLQYCYSNNIPNITTSLSKTGIISRIMGSKSADQLRKDADRIIANR